MHNLGISDLLPETILDVKIQANLSLNIAYTYPKRKKHTIGKINTFFSAQNLKCYQVKIINIVQLSTVSFI